MNARLPTSRLLAKWLGPGRGAVLAWFVFFTLVIFFAAIEIAERAYGVPFELNIFHDFGPETMRFERPWAAFALLAVPLVLWRRGFLDHKWTPRLRVSRAADMARAGGSWKTLFLPILPAIRAAVVFAIAIALMGPQSIHARDSSEVDGIDIVLTLDLSLSMEAADITPNRFNAAQAVVDEFIRRRPNDRIGAVIFGKEAYTLLPLTTDHEALRNMVSELQLGMIEGRGTAIGNALGVSLNRLRKSTAKSKVVILLTDGESNSGNVSPEQAADFAKTMGVKVYTVLMGESDEANVQRGQDLFGRPIVDRGNFPINPALLETMAKKTGAEAFRATDRKGLEESFHNILNRLEKSQIQDAGRVYGELFPALLGPALLLLVLELLATTFIFRRFP